MTSRRDARSPAPAGLSMSGRGCRGVEGAVSGDGREREGPARGPARKRVALALHTARLKH
jgi:hypothetical protein